MPRSGTTDDPRVLGADETLPGDDPSLPTGGSADGPAPLKAGDRVSRYLVLGRIGAGGMGEVFAAYDPELDRKIALKLLHAGLGMTASTTGRGRLLREAQAMARLTHPNTVTVHDVGEHDGRVFLAMEFVEGQTLRQWLETPRSWRAVVQVFVAAGRGLAAAHAVGLIHRDFKPDNVMLADDGRVLVMDFGLARASEGAVRTDRSPAVEAAPVFEDEAEQGMSLSGSAAPSSSRLSTSLTRTGALTGTPAYMAPEQFLGQPVDGRTDQFSFCVALYEALCGERPFAANNLPALADEVSRGTVRPMAGGRGIPPWLRRVVLRGLVKSPEQRWPDMPSLVAALQADPAGRSKKLALAGVCVAVLASAGALTWRATSTARVCSDSATQLEHVWSEERRTLLRDEALETGLHYADQTADEVESLLTAWSSSWLEGHREACEASELHRSQSAEVKDQRMRCLDRQRRQFATLVEDLIRGEASVLEQAVARAEALPSVARCSDLDYVAALVPPPADPDLARQVDELRVDLGRLELTDEHDLDPRQVAERLPQLEALRVRAETLDYAPLIAEIDLQVGRHLLRTGQGEGGESALRRAFLAARRHGLDAVAIDAAVALIEALGRVQARYRSALDWADHAEVEIARSGTTLDEPRRLRRLAQVHFGMGEFATAEGVLREAIESYGRELPADSLILARTRLEAIKTLLPRGRIDEAERELDEVEPVIVRRLGSDHPEMGSLEHVRIHFALERRHFEEARERGQALLAFYERAGLQHDPRTATELQNLGMAYVGLGDEASARRMWERALTLRQEILDPEHPDVADLIINLASLKSSGGDGDATIARYQRAIAIYEGAGATQSPKAASARLNIGNVLFGLGRAEESLHHFARAAELFGASLGRDADRTLQSRAYHAYVLRSLERYDESVALLRENLELLRHRRDPDRWLSDTAAMLMTVELERGRSSAAAELLEIAERIDHGSLGPESSFNLRFTILRVRHTLGQPAQVREEVASLQRELSEQPERFPPQAEHELAQWLRETR